MRAVVLLVLLVLPLLPAPARAQPETATQQAARGHFEMGRRQHELGNYLLAVEEFKQAYLAQPEPLILFDIAQSYRRAGKPEEARDFYRRFIERVPPSPQRRVAAQMVSEIEAQLAHNGAPAPPSAAEPAAPGAGSRKSFIGAGVGTGTGASSTIAGTTATRPPSSATSGGEAGPVIPSRAAPELLLAPPPARPSRRRLWLGLGIGAGVLGAAALVTGLVLGLRSGAPSSDLGTYPVLR